MLLTLNFHLQNFNVNTLLYICIAERPINPIIIQKGMERGHRHIFHYLTVINRDKRNVVLRKNHDEIYQNASCLFNILLRRCRIIGSITNDLNSHRKHF